MTTMLNSVFVLLFAFAVDVAIAQQSGSGYGRGQYDGCAEKLDILEKALYDTGSNRFELSSVFFPPSQRPTRFIKVMYSFETEDDCNVTYIWAIGAFLFFQPPSVFQFTSLFFNYPNNDLTYLRLDLPSECKGLVLHSENSTTCSCSDETPLLDSVTQQINIYAAFTDPSNLHRQNSFARAVCAEDLHVIYDGQRAEFAFIIICIAILLPLSFILITFILLRNAKESLVSSFHSHHGKLVALVLVGLTVSVGVLVCDVFACHIALSPNHEYAEYVPSKSLNLRITFATLVLDCIFILPQFLALFFIFCHNIKLFLKKDWHFGPLHSFLKKFTAFMAGPKMLGEKSDDDDNDAIAVILPLMLLPPFLCFSTHLGYILLSWLTEPPKCTTQVLLLYVTLGFLFVMLKKCYKLHSSVKITLETIDEPVSQQPANEHTPESNTAGRELMAHQVEFESPQPAAGESKPSIMESNIDETAGHELTPQPGGEPRATVESNTDKIAGNEQVEVELSPRASEPNDSAVEKDIDKTPESDDLKFIVPQLDSDPTDSDANEAAGSSDLSQVKVETPQSATSDPKTSLAENKVITEVKSPKISERRRSYRLSITSTDAKVGSDDSADSPPTPDRKDYVNTQVFCLMFVYGIFIVGICAMIILMFVLLPLASEAIVVYLFNALQLVILLISTQFAYKVFLDSDGFSINKFWKSFRDYFTTNKNEVIELRNKKVLTVLKDDEATNSQTAGVVAAGLTDAIMKKLN